MTDKTQHDARVSARDDATTSSETSLPAPSRIKLLYESRDKRLCIFEDAHGHLTAVRASRLA